MKTWTVVIEIQEDAQFTKQEIEKMFSSLLQNSPIHTFQIFECVQAAYGPQPGDVVLRERQQ